MWPEMATIQWRTTLWTLLAGIVVGMRCANGCHPLSRELHVCLNIYLERDFPLIEAIVQTQARAGQWNRGRIILEGNDLQNICSHISSLRECFAPLARECRALWQFDRFARVLGLLRDTHDYLCADGTDKLRDILLNSGCLVRTKTHLDSCSGFDWWMSWRKVLRMEVTPQANCVALERYGDCLKHRLGDVVCGSEAARVYMPFFEVWLKSWCAAGSTPEEDYIYIFYFLNQISDMLKQFNKTESG